VIYNWQKYNSYRFGFNGKEKDDEWTGSTGATYDYGFRIYDSRTARFLSVDPLAKSFPFYTPYQFAGNGPIANLDLDGLEDIHYYFVWDKKSRGYDLSYKIVNEEVVARTVTAHFIDEKGETVSQIGESYVDPLHAAWYYATYLDKRGILVYGSSGSGADSPGNEAVEVWGSFDFAAFSEAMGLILTAMQSKGENSIKKEFTGYEATKLLDNVKSTAEYIDQNKDATDSDKKEVAENSFNEREDATHFQCKNQPCKYKKGVVPIDANEDFHDAGSDTIFINKNKEKN